MRKNLDIRSRATVRSLTLALTALILAAPPTPAQEAPKSANAPGGKPQTPNITTDTGKPVGTDDHSLTAGPEGPTLLEHFYFLEKIAHFDRERIPERVVHARGVGVHGEFVCTVPQTAITKAAFLSVAGKKSPVFTRFSTVVLPKGSADSARDVRGFAVKFYTEEGNYDLVGNDIPVFFIRDAIKFPDLVHSLKPSPVTNVQEPERFFDFFSALPETTHMLTFLFSDEGTPASFRQIDGFGVNTFKWVNAANEQRYVKYRWKSAQGTKFNTDEQAKKVAGDEPAALTKELYDTINAGDFPSWDLQVQVVSPDEFKKFDFDPLDATKLWPETIVAFKTVGRMTLNRVPNNFFEQTEQVAFNTGAYVPGVEPSEDRLLQGRNFSYSDTQRHRLGPNYQQLPINQPTRPVVNVNQEGLADHMQRKGDVNYGPSTKQPDRVGVAEQYKFSTTKLVGPVQHATVSNPKDFQQAGDRLRAMDGRDREHLIKNLCGEFKKVKTKAILVRQIGNFYRADEAFGRDLAKAAGVEIEQVQKLLAQAEAPR